MTQQGMIPGSSTVEVDTLSSGHQGGLVQEVCGKCYLAEKFTSAASSEG